MVLNKWSEASYIHKKHNVKTIFEVSEEGGD
jgi:hypothetical protein